jgi:peroxiredoxin Q/BCP
MLHEGTRAPDFILQGQDQQDHSLSEQWGRPVVIYFYPQDEKPACTAQACSFRDYMSAIAESGAVVYGISRDSVASHAAFHAHYDLNFTLLSDPDLAVHEKYGVLSDKDGSVMQSTFIIDEDGMITSVWPNAVVAGHVDAIIRALSE